jgi:hypothetical protein
MRKIHWKWLLALKNTSYNIKGMFVCFLKKKWKKLSYVIKQFVTYEGRYGMVFYFHI